jgi:hypothetical protein
MNVKRMILLATVLAPVLTVADCGPKQPPGPDADLGQCFAQPRCTGGQLLQNPPMAQCKAAGGKSWSGITQNYCTNL